jgi:hypothetical protein
MARVGHNGVEAHPLDYVPRHRSPNALPSSDPDVSEPDASVERLLAGVVPAKRQRDARTMLDLMARVTGQAPKVDRNAAGFGSYHYRYASDHEGTAAAAGFAPRKNALVVYVVNGVGAHADLLERLGPHTTGVGCIYLRDLTLVDLAILEQIMRTSYATLTAGTYTLRAREGGRA